MDGTGLIAAASGTIGKVVSSIVPIGSGGNNRVYRIETNDGSRFVLKWYFQDALGNRNRLGVEFQALQFLSAHGVGSVPRPVAVNPSAEIAIYEFVDGEPAMASGIGPEDIAAVLAFARQLRSLSRQPEASVLLPASDACFSLHDFQSSLRKRAARLEAVAANTNAERALHRFLDCEFRTAMRATIEQSAAQLIRAGIAVDVALPAECRTLSPSDFGFHNAIRRGGELVFVDFEYFGWDDPAKLICDFLLHPAMLLSERFKQQFARGAIRDSGYDSKLPVRVSALYPLFALNWCLILLNEFLPDQLQRRRFAVDFPEPMHNVQMRQLAKARMMLASSRVPALT